MMGLDLATLAELSALYRSAFAASVTYPGA